MGKKNNVEVKGSPKQFKIAGILGYVFGVPFTLLGLITFPFGIIFLVFSIPLVYMGYSYSKKSKAMVQEENERKAKREQEERERQERLEKLERERQEKLEREEIERQAKIAEAKRKEEEQRRLYEEAEKNRKAKAEEIARKYNIRCYQVAGTSFHADIFEELGSLNDDYSLGAKKLINDGYEDEHVYKYDFYDTEAELIPEPNNEHDPNAVRVDVDGLTIGYIKRTENVHVKEMLEKGRIDKVTCRMGGGAFKIAYYNADEKAELDKGEAPYSATLTVYELKEETA